MVPLLESTATAAGPVPTVMVPGPPKIGKAAAAAGVPRARARAPITPAEASRPREWRSAADKQTPVLVMAVSPSAARVTRAACVAEFPESPSGDRKVPARLQKETGGWRGM